MDKASQAFYDAIVAALGPFLGERLKDLGISPDSDVVDGAVKRCAADLSTLFELGYDEQTETPLQVVRRTVRAVEEESAIAVPEGDVAPASAAELGEAALAASLNWGSAKAAALRRPAVLVHSTNLLDASGLEEAAAGAGYRVARSPEAGPLAAFVDLEAPDSDRVIEALAAAGVKVIAYGPHVDDLALARARTLGATTAEPRSRVLRDPGVFLPPVV